MKVIFKRGSAGYKHFFKIRQELIQKELSEKTDINLISYYVKKQILNKYNCIFQIKMEGETDEVHLFFQTEEDCLLFLLK